MSKLIGGKVCEEFTPGYYGVCAIGGMLSAGTTHLAITPLDVLKVNMQVHPIKYSSISTCFTTLLREQGPSAFWRGWAGKFFGYGVQGACRFGLYEYFKKVYSNVLVDQNKSLIFFASSASAEVIANVALCPFEAIKVRVQAQPHFAKGLSDGFPRIYASEGLHGFYRGLIPLLGRNIPCISQSLTLYSVDFLFCFLYSRYILFGAALSCLSLSQGSIGNNLSTSEVRLRFAYTLSSSYPTLWDYTGYAVVISQNSVAT
ncbi:hypothetical protein H5410_013957 [Solanum commersonii]|uniref:Mitochondrial phosphate carrier protein n=1 Tax=Solanum commersonii TaxID=4109 RepID=A0A9J5ZPL6_SOLCO|nr:hypothetical protein H5410_013957 [Solanum commersonii]